MTPAALDAIGNSIWGDRWQASMARALGVTTQTTGRWARGDVPIPDDIEKRLSHWLGHEAGRLAGIQWRLDNPPAKTRRAG
jgi:hypothetical protein